MKENSYDIYQLKNEEKNRYIKFMGMDYLRRKGIPVQRDNYDLVYHAPLGDNETLDSIYETFNLRHPADFRGHSLSVSDVVVFHKDGADTAHYVDRFGFADVPEFLKEQERTQGLTMDSTDISVNQHIGTWHPIEQQKIDGKDYFLLEHDTYGQDAAAVIVDASGVLYAQDVYDGFSEEIIQMIRMEATPVEIMPDPTVSVADMEQYGYYYKGMVPLGGEVAKEYFNQHKFMLFALHPDGSETVVSNEKQMQRHLENGGMFAVDKQDWMKYLENGEYLRTAEITEEQNYNMIDGRHNNQKPKKTEVESMVSEPENEGEKPSVLGRLKAKQELLANTSKKDAPAPEKKPEHDMQ
jgi:hypothetical protein